jgi:hypothetical protein
MPIIVISIILTLVLKSKDQMSLNQCLRDNYVKALILELIRALQGVNQSLSITGFDDKKSHVDGFVRACCPHFAKS